MSKKDLITKTKVELLKLARRFGLRGISTLNKPELIGKLQRAKQRKPATAEVKRRAIRKHNTIKAKLLRRAAVKKVAARIGVTHPPRRGAPAKPAPVTAKMAEELAAHKFDVSSKLPPPKQAFKEEHLGELPDTYGTGRLFLVARDSRWLFAYWDLSGQQMADCRRQAADDRLVLRLYEKNRSQPLQELTLHHDARNWYIQVNQGATTYRAELGYWQRDGQFHAVSRSRETTTPPDVVSADASARFVTIPVDLPFGELLNIVRKHLGNGEQLAEALHRLQKAGHKFPFRVDIDLGPWSPEQTAALERALGGDVLRRAQVGSVEIAEWLRRRLQEESSSGLSSGFSPGGASWSGAPQKGFWFAVNAELTIYGATEPGAEVTVDGQPVALRHDGTFSFHWAFPDGKYQFPVVAVSAKDDDLRAVELEFVRKTTAHGEVGAVAQAPQLNQPKTVQ